jgi:DNA-binding transcriptional LysR family regulator
MNIELVHLRRARALAENRSFALAARELHISQPALSRSIQELEVRVGTTLFERGGGTVELTDAGRHLLSHAADLLRRADHLVEELHLLGDAGSGELRIGSGLFPADLVVGGAIAHLSRDHPHLRIRLITDNWLALTSLVRKGQIGMAVVEVSGCQDDPAFSISCQLRVQGCFAVRTGHPLLGRESPAMSDVVRYPMAAPSQLPARFVDGLLKSMGAGGHANHHLRPMQPVIACDSISLIKSIAAQSDAIGLVAASLVAEEVNAGKLALLPLEEPWNWGLFGLVQLAGRSLTSHGISFQRCLEECVQERLALEESARASFPGRKRTTTRRRPAKPVAH